MWRRFKLGGVLVLAIGALMLIEGLPIAETLAATQNSNSSTVMQNSSSKPGLGRRRHRRRRGRRHRRGRRG